MASSWMLEPSSKDSFIIESICSEKRWIDQIHKILAAEVMVEIEPVSIFHVPSTLRIYKPEVYTPQVVALGPYHHFRRELYDMERFKLMAASRLQKDFKTLEFKELVKGLKQLEHRVRACYHKYLDIEGETLAWIIAIDGLFFLDFLQAYTKSPSTTARLVDSTGRKLAFDSILGDLMMLENQIPIFLLGEILSIQCPSIPDLANNVLHPMLMEFVKSFSPLKIKDDPTLFEASKDANHLLDFLHKLIVPKLDDGTLKPDDSKNETEAPDLDKTMSFDSSTMSEFVPKLWSMACELHLKLVNKIEGPVNSVVKLLLSLAGMSGMLRKKDQETGKPENESLNPPNVEEINIPSVTDLSKFGVEFRNSTGGIESVNFDPRTDIFTLPVITLDVYSKVVMRNLVAYEVSIAPESLVFTRYMELMHGIVDTAEDASLLEKKNIIVSHLKSDAEVAEIFNGMSKSVKLTNVPHIDKTIKDVNTFFYSMRAVRMCKRMKMLARLSWKLLTLLAVVMLLLMMGLQSFCSVYRCNNIFRNITSN
ncbi:hypothetical protein Vadar_024576 [Vaccinium darrowii]|uniref:Uncharacterized protein n=1 Tax=Vaccinium darrowii TaxID=229202 RepID=A0ACB7X3E6_9ERIC|nr:hypothetical protein Vadar_024576 [Vaccinium darrowii]